MNFKKIKELTLEIKKLEQELDIEKNLVLEYFRGMEECDMALYDNKLGGNGVIVQYCPASTEKRVDSAKLKEDGIYDKYVKTINKTDYVRISVAKEV